MNLQINAITLAVNDLSRAKKFYAEGLGCTIDQDHPGFVSLKVGDSPVNLGLYTRDALAADAGVPGAGSGFGGVVFNHIVESEARVTEMMALAERAGATIIRTAQKAKWGGYFGHFSDPDGYIWKVSGY